MLGLASMMPLPSRGTPRCRGRSIGVAWALPIMPHDGAPPGERYGFDADVGDAMPRLSESERRAPPMPFVYFIGPRTRQSLIRR